MIKEGCYYTFPRTTKNKIKVKHYHKIGKQWVIGLLLLLQQPLIHLISFLYFSTHSGIPTSGFNWQIKTVLLARRWKARTFLTDSGFSSLASSSWCWSSLSWNFLSFFWVLWASCFLDSIIYLLGFLTTISLWPLASVLLFIPVKLFFFFPLYLQL